LRRLAKAFLFKLLGLQSLVFTGLQFQWTSQNSLLPDEEKTTKNRQIPTEASKELQ